MSKSTDEDLQDTSAGKGSGHQAWQPEMDPLKLC